MTYAFELNEFTDRDLLEYMFRIYGTQISGRPFSKHNINVWVRRMKLPDAYGGNRITKVDIYREFGNLRIITVELLDRDDIEYFYGSLSKFSNSLNIRKAGSNKRRKPKLRTELYYQVLGSRCKNRGGIRIPNNYKELGIKENQFKRRQR